MRRKSDFTNSLTEMFCEDQKKRILAVKSLRDIATNIGPARTKTQLVPFLHCKYFQILEFLDDEPAVMLAVLAEITNFSQQLGGAEHEKILLPLLISFCGLDERQVGYKAADILKSILEKNTDSYLDSIKRIIKPNMTVSKECGAILIINAISKVPHLEQSFLELYKTLIMSQDVSYRIVGAKYLKSLCDKVSNKGQILKMVDIIYNDNEELPKLLIIDTLLKIYPLNPNSILAKLKTLISNSTWRINIRICECANLFTQSLSKSHYKVLLEPHFLKLMASEDAQTRAAACQALPGIAKNMTADENSNKLLPVILKLSEDKAKFVKNEYSKNVIKVFPHFPKDKVQSSLIPIIIKFIKQSNLQVCSSILSEFKELSNYLSPQKCEQTILKPLAGQMQSENWRLKIITLDILSKLIIDNSMYTPFVADFLINLMKDRIEATRKKAVNMTVNLINTAKKDWCDTVFIPKLMKLKDETSYLLRQKLINVMSETANHVSNSTLGEYKSTLIGLLCDKIPNTRIMCIKAFISNKKLIDKSIEQQILKMKDDPDQEVKGFVKTIKF